MGVTTVDVIVETLRVRCGLPSRKLGSGLAEKRWRRGIGFQGRSPASSSDVLEWVQETGGEGRSSWSKGQFCLGTPSPAASVSTHGPFGAVV